MPRGFGFVTVEGEDGRRFHPGCSSTNGALQEDAVQIALVQTTAVENAREGTVSKDCGTRTEQSGSSGTLSEKSKTFGFVRAGQSTDQYGYLCSG